MNQTIDYIKSLNIPKNDYIILGCSGGPDSMCLLTLLYKEHHKIVIAHVNHNIRQESAQEYAFLEKYALSKNIPFEGLVLSKSEHQNESFYRKKRYNFYKDLAVKYQTKYIMTAHHGDDLIETILMRLSRGSNLKGYIGFTKDYLENDFRIIKPLTYSTKDEIILYNNTNSIPYFTDKTNEQDTYTRNRYRHYVLPFLKKENPKVHLKYIEFSKELEEANAYIEREVESALEQNFKDQKIELNHFFNLDKFIQRKEIEYILKTIYKDDIDKIKKKHIDNIFSLLDKSTNFSLDLPKNIKVKREYSLLKFTYNTTVDASYEFILNNEVVLNNGDIIEKIQVSEDNSNYTIKLSSKDISLPLKVRSRKKGDKMEIKNLHGSKKIKEIMIEAKINPSQRDAYPIVTDNNDTVLWIPGIKKSKFDNENSEKCDIILRYVKKGTEFINEKHEKQSQ